MHPSYSAGVEHEAIAEMLAANRANWDDRVAVHTTSRFYDVERWLREARGPRPWEAEILGPVSGLRLVHLQCHFGLDTLAWARAGATVTGLDFSPAAVAAATGLAERAGLSGASRFVCADVHRAVEALGGAAYDIVYVSLGALCWLPSVRAWAAQAAGLLAPGGRLFLHDSHPLAWAMADEELTVAYTYFEEAVPFVEDSPLTYTDGDLPIAHTRSYEWNHSLGEIVTAVLDQGLVLERLHEHDWTSFARFPWLVRRDEQRWEPPPGRPRVPLSFTLVARRPAAPADPGTPAEGGRR
jgi:SAM-dependent methyltransferase